MKVYISIFPLHRQQNLCHFGMTPLRTILQQVNDTPYTTPAKIGPKIGARAYCRNVISSRGLFRLDLNTPLQIAVGHFFLVQTNVLKLFFRLLFKMNIGSDSDTILTTLKWHFICTTKEASYSKNDKDEHRNS